MIVSILLGVVIISLGLYMLDGSKGCHGDCRQGRDLCNCKEKKQ